MSNGIIFLHIYVENTVQQTTCESKTNKDVSSGVIWAAACRLVVKDTSDWSSGDAVLISCTEMFNSSYIA